MANDDGINAKGLRALADEISTIADVYVVAPDGERSAMGHCISCRDKIYLERQDFSGAVMAYKCSGTPADCVKLGIDFLGDMDIEMDFVVTGINHGGNLGTDTHYSGTVSAALEGVMNKVSSIAVSVVSHEAHFFEYPAKLAKDAVPSLFDFQWQAKSTKGHPSFSACSSSRGLSCGWITRFKAPPSKSARMSIW